ncbi:hypothetical protein LPJ66_006202, partial [Kickxella alabastrina]
YRERQPRGPVHRRLGWVCTAAAKLVYQRVFHAAARRRRLVCAAKNGSPRCQQCRAVAVGNGLYDVQELAAGYVGVLSNQLVVCPRVLVALPVEAPRQELLRCVFEDLPQRLGGRAQRALCQV